MNPNYVHTITLYRRQDDGSYSRDVFEDCFWHAGTAVTQNGTNASKSNIYTVRIPLEKAGPGFCVSLNNDIVVLGECADEISNEKGSRVAEILLKHKPDAFKITVFSRNTGHLMDKHYRLGG